jgi:hypothetical protein
MEELARPAVDAEYYRDPISQMRQLYDRFVHTSDDSAG